MDFGLMEQWEKNWWPSEEQCEGSTVLDTDAVSGNVQCHKCGGWGHLARECPSKGKAKGKNASTGALRKGERAGLASDRDIELSTAR